MPAVELAALLGTPAAVLLAWAAVATVRARHDRTCPTCAVGPRSDRGVGLAVSGYDEAAPQPGSSRGFVSTPRVRS